MQSRIPLLGISLAIAFIAAMVAGIRFSTPKASPVEALNYRVQERFRTLTAFGMKRLPVVPQHVDQFDPETPEEKAAVEGLRSQGWTVGLYLGGLGLLQSPMSEAEWEKDGRYSLRKAISEPIVISGETTPADLPKPWELQEINRRALKASTDSDEYKTSWGRWSVDIRPVRASRMECLECHTAGGTDDDRTAGSDQEPNLRVGDALGVAIYVYARKPERQIAASP